MNTPSPEELRIVIAKHHTGIDWVFDQCWCVVEKGKKIARPKGPLDYTQSLDAMHEAEKVLTSPNEQVHFDSELEKIRARKRMFLWELGAEDHAEAFCRTVKPEMFETKEKGNQ